MSDPNNLNQFAGELRSLSPLAGHLDRDQLMFRAGQASAPRPTRLWPISAGLLSLACLALAAVVVLRPNPAPVEHVVYVPVHESPPSVVAANEPELPFVAPPRFTEGTSYLRYRDQVIRWGPDALPHAAAADAPPKASRLAEQLDMPPGSQRGAFIGGQTF